MTAVTPKSVLAFSSGTGGKRGASNIIILRAESASAVYASAFLAEFCFRKTLLSDKLKIFAGRHLTKS